jgi:flagellar biosynthesis protein FliR
MDLPIDFSGVWTWFLLFTRLSGVLFVLPGIGTDEVPMTFRASIAMLLAAVMTAAGAHAASPGSLAEGALMIGTEFLLGYVLGVIPAMIVYSLSVAGQVSAAAIGLGQATLIDISLGESISVLARIEAMIATAIFLLIDGHHVVLRAAFSTMNDVGIGMFRPSPELAALFVDRFQASFDLAITVSGPVLVTILLTQFVMGLLTKFVPQVNIFIISLPLTIAVGLFVTEFTLPALVRVLLSQFNLVEELLARVLGGA